MTPQAIVDNAKAYAIEQLTKLDNGHDGKAMERLLETTAKYWADGKEFSFQIRAPNGERAPPEIRARYEHKTFGFSDPVHNVVNLNGELLKDDVYAIAMTALHELAHAARGEQMDDFLYRLTGGHDDLWEDYARAFGIAAMRSGDVKALSHKPEAWRPELWKLVNTWKDGE